MKTILDEIAEKTRERIAKKKREIPTGRLLPIFWRESKAGRSKKNRFFFRRAFPGKDFRSSAR